MPFEPITLIFAIFVSLVFSGLFSASETALTTASKPRMLTLEQNGNRRAALVNKLWVNKDLVISAILVGNNLTNIFSSTAAAALMIEIFGDTGIVYATAIMSVIIILSVEILPKTIALRHADASALFLAPFAYGAYLLLGPVTIVCRAIINRVLMPFKTKSLQAHEDAAEEEIRGIIDMHAGLFDRGQQSEMLHAIVDFADMSVEDVMQHRKDMVSVPIGQPIEKLVQDLLDANHNYVPLWGKSPEDIVGVIDTRKLLSELARRNGNFTGLEIGEIVAPPWFIPNTTGLLDQLMTFRKRRVNVAFVVDEYGVLQGMIALADILEEIVGHYDRGQFNALAVPRPLADGSLIMDGRFPIRELNRELNWELPDEESSTLAGFVLELAQRIPEPGERFHYKNFQFTVMARKKNSLSLIRIRILKNA